MAALTVTTTQVQVSSDTSLAAGAIDYGQSVFKDPNATPFPSGASGPR